MDEQTKVPIKWLFILLSMSGSAIILSMSLSFWLSKVEAKTDEAQKQTSELKAVGSNTDIYLRSIDQRLSRIEGALGVRK